MAAVIIMMIAATVVERLAGSDVAFRYFYHSPLFIALWAVAAICGLVYALSRGMKRLTLLLHISFVVILCGALVTHVFGDSGMIHLRVGESSGIMYHKDGSTRTMPFEMTLLDFEVERYPGSMAASDYRSTVETSDGARMDISMNKIGKHRGFRFYQSDFDQDGKGSVLAVTYDPWGVGITYTGYLLLLVSLIGFFFQKDTAFRRTLKKLASVSAAFLLLPQIGSAVEKTELPPAVPRQVADEFSQLYVYYNDRVAPFQTLARDYCLKAYGEASYEGYTAEQVVTGWLFYYDWWTAVPFKVKAKDRGTMRETEKESIRMSAASGEAFKLYPVSLSDSVRVVNPEIPAIVWFSCDDDLPSDLDYDHWVFIRRSLDLIHDEVNAENWDEVIRIVRQIRKYQEKTAASVLPSDRHVRAERFYNRISRPLIPFMASISLGILLFLMSCILLPKDRAALRSGQHILAVVSGTMFLYLTLVLGLRWYVSGHAPLAGSYSVMMLMAWVTSLVMTLTYRKFDLIQPLGFILAGFTMLMASLASANPQVTHLMPVLQSPLLSIHVLSMMISYTLFALVALNGVMGLCVGERDTREMLRDVSLVILYPAIFLLTFGTFVGAVWANVSWGSYWTWDPKETWALVTLLIYSATVHSGSIKVFRNPKFFHIFCIIAFLSVLITYFGVNMLLGGMHSYA